MPIKAIDIKRGQALMYGGQLHVVLRETHLPDLDVVLGEHIRIDEGPADRPGELHDVLADDRPGPHAHPTAAALE